MAQRMKTREALSEAIRMARQRAEGSGEEWSVWETEDRYVYDESSAPIRGRRIYTAQPDGELLGVRSDGSWSAMRRAGSEDRTEAHAMYPRGYDSRCGLCWLGHSHSERLHADQIHSAQSAAEGR